MTYGVGGFLLGDYSAQAGWLTSALLAHGTSVTVLLVALPFLVRRRTSRPAASAIGWAAAAGLTDVVGLLAFSRGGSVGQVAVTAAVSSVYPAIPLVAGLAIFGERLSRRQFAGVGLIIGGLVLIGLASDLLCGARGPSALGQGSSALFGHGFASGFAVSSPDSMARAGSCQIAIAVFMRRKPSRL